MSVDCFVVERSIDKPQESSRLVLSESSYVCMWSVSHVVDEYTRLLLRSSTSPACQQTRPISNRIVLRKIR